MAETITRQLREPFVEAAGPGITNKGLGLLGKSIPTSTYTGRGFVAGQSNLEQQAATAAQGLGGYQSQLGGAQRQIEQGQLAADQEAAREAAFADYTQLGLVAPQLASVIGGFPAATQMQSTPPPSTTQQLLGLGIGAAGLGGAVSSMFGR